MDAAALYLASANALPQIQHVEKDSDGDDWVISRHVPGPVLTARIVVTRARTAWEGEAPAEPKARQRLSGSFALPRCLVVRPVIVSGALRQKHAVQIGRAAGFA
jgi:hypothetical protein